MVRNRRAKPERRSSAAKPFPRTKMANVLAEKRMEPEPQTERAGMLLDLDAVASILGLAPKTVANRIKDDELIYYPVSGLVCILKVTRIGPGLQGIMFDKKDVDFLEETLLTQKRTTITAKEMSEELQKAGIDLTPQQIVVRFRPGKCKMDEDGARLIEHEEQEHAIKLRTGRTPWTPNKTLRYMSREHFAIFLSWMVATYDKAKCAKHGHSKKPKKPPKGHLWLKDASGHFGISVTRLRRLTREGRLTYRRTAGNLIAIPISELDSLVSKEKGFREVPAESVRFYPSLKSIGCTYEGRVVRRKGKLYFNFEDYKGDRVQFRIYMLNKGYWISKKDFNAIRMTEQMFGPQGVFLTLDDVSQSTQWTYEVLRKKINAKGELELTLPNGKVHKIPTVKRYGVRYVRSDDLFEFKRQSKLIKDGIVYRSQVATALGFSSVGSLESWLRRGKISVNWQFFRNLSESFITRSELATLKLLRGGKKTNVGVPGHELVLCDEYGIVIPVENGAIDSKYVDLLMFSRELFLKSRAHAIITILDFLAEPDQISGDVEIAKLWLVRWYYLSSDLPLDYDVPLGKALSSKSLAAKFTDDCIDHSEVFRGRPFFSELELDLLHHDFSDGFDSDHRRAGFQYPATIGRG